MRRFNYWTESIKDAMGVAILLGIAGFATYTRDDFYNRRYQGSSTNAPGCVIEADFRMKGSSIQSEKMKFYRFNIDRDSLDAVANWNVNSTNWNISNYNLESRGWISRNVNLELCDKIAREVFSKTKRE